MNPYRPAEDILTTLNEKTLIMIVGPTAIGKSSLMNMVTQVDNRFKRVSRFTTRAPRANDEPGLYRYLSRSQVEDLVTRRQVVNCVTFPTTGESYGTELQDFPGEYNTLDTLANSVEAFRQLPFKRTIVVSLTAPSADWLNWLTHRFPKPNDERTKRLIEAKQSIEWSLTQKTNHHWVINQPDDLTTTAQQLIELVHHPADQSPTPAEERKLLIMVNDLLSYKQ